MSNTRTQTYPSYTDDEPMMQRLAKCIAFELSAGGNAAAAAMAVMRDVRLGYISLPSPALLASIRAAVEAERGLTNTVLAAQLMMIKRPLAESVYRCDTKRLQARAALDALLSGEETVHQCPPDGSGIMPCCGRAPFEVLADRMATDPALVTCKGHAS